MSRNSNVDDPAIADVKKSENDAMAINYESHNMRSPLNGVSYDIRELSLSSLGRQVHTGSLKSFQ